MRTAPLKLRYTESALREPVAWVIADPSPSTWVRVILEAGIPAADCTLYVLPTSASDRAARRALLIPPAGASLGTSVSCRPYGCIAGRLYLPVEARIEPEVAPEEWPALLPAEGCCLWHPSVGLIGFEPHEAQRVSDFLRAPQAQEPTWDHAVPGIALNARLRGIIPLWGGTAEEVLTTGGDEIGTEPIVEPLDSPEKQPGSIPKWLALPIALAGMPLQWLGNLIPGMNKLADALGKYLPPLPQLEAKRLKELERLVNMLQSNPDEALRYAIPFGGDAHRGRAPAGGELQQRSTDFDLRSLQKSQAADFWNIPPDVQAQLTAHYRRLALRELQLGRHRRAAYIYAQLLGDLTNAVNALKQGRFFREAAVIYRDRLNQPLEAARCLAEGGLWREAAEAYEKQSAYEAAGDLWQKLEETEQARSAYRQAIDVRNQHGDILSVARLLHEKLDERDEALAQLDAAWPQAKQNVLCLREGLRLRSEWGRHDEVGDRIGQLVAQELPEEAAIGAAEVLAETAQAYPVAEIRTSATDATRVLTAHHLDAAVPANRERFMTALKSLARQDRLLERDCRRYLERPAAATDKPKAQSRARGEIRLMARTQTAIQWVSAVTAEDAWYAVGVRNEVFVVARQRWSDGTGVIEQMAFSQARHRDLIQFVGPQSRALRIDICAPATWKEPREVLCASADFPRAIEIRLRDLRSERLAGIARSLSNGMTWTLVEEGDEMVLNGVNADYAILSHRVLPAAQWGWLNPMHAREEGVYIVAGKELIAYASGNPKPPFETIELPTVGTSIAGSGPFTRLRIAVGLEQGSVTIWWEAGKARLLRCAEDLVHTVVGFTRSGRLVVAAENGCEVYSTSDGKLKFLGATDIPNGTPVAVTSTCDADGFALFLSDGRILQSR
jgi:hypothetical protein